MSPSPVNLTSLAPVLVVDSVEDCLPFWIDRFGFEKGPEVSGPDGKLVFAMMAKGAIEIMYQTRASVLAEEPDATRAARNRELQGHSVVLFLEVQSIDAVELALAGVKIVKPRHDTFYGTTEIYALEPGGNVVGFSARKA
jgi:uncharacterized glyoxalase superfamily protein PhnB